MDSFEARGQFAKILRRLNAGSRSNEYGVRFLRENPDLIEDLFRCLMSELAECSVNQRVNIVYFLAYVANVPSQRLSVFRQLTNQNITDIVNRAVPANLHGIVNIDHIHAVLDSLAAANVVPTAKVKEIKEALAEKRKQVKSGHGEAQSQMSRQDILRRMDDDRERWKKAKERYIAVDPEEPVEFREYWHALGPLTELDFEHIEEQNEIAQRSKRGLFT